MMSLDENSLKNLLEKLPFDDLPSSSHRDRLEAHLLHKWTARTARASGSKLLFEKLVYMGSNIMKNRRTKLAVAALLLGAIGIGIYLSGGSIDGATVTFAQVTEAMKNVPWMACTHKVIFGVTPVVLKDYCCFDQKITACQFASGIVRWMDYGHQLYKEYNPESQTITINDTPCDPLEFEKAATPLQLIEQVFQKEQQKKVVKKFTQTKGEHEGRDVQIWELERGGDKAVKIIRLIVDLHTHLPAVAEITVSDLQGNPRSLKTVTFEYPDPGPEDIYDLGVPETAKIIDQTQ